tara:strand:+ start:9030 stop:10100 length:1071 start_codon:yes stop_codon:yes gene_type:complete
MSTINPGITINDKVFSQKTKGLIVAEGACNHLCVMDNAYKMIDEVAKAKADAIKFQTYSADKLTSKSAKAYGNISTKSQYEYYRQFDRFGRAEYDDLFEYSKEKGIIAFSTPFDPENAQMLNSVHMPIFKIASCDIQYLDLLKEVACFQKPIILSTGGSTLEEINNSLEILDKYGAGEVALLACTLSYPTEIDDANYRKIINLIKEFPNNLIGISDHVEPEKNMISGAICASLGAKIFEKHFTLDNKMGGGSSYSMNPNELKGYVRNIRLSERLLGESEQKVYDAEKETRNSSRRSLVANCDIKVGSIISREIIGVKRPGTGIPPKEMDKVVGLKVIKKIFQDQQLAWENFKNSDE